MVNVISVDVEEYFHAANLAEVAPRNSWNWLPSRVSESTKKTLDIFERNNTKGTFFVLGQVAEKHPDLVKQIHNAGHEVASHGYDHRIAYEQSPNEFFEDVKRSKDLLEELTGREVLGYRAPNFSITAKNPWAIDALIKAGYSYDSSKYPIWHPRYANVNEKAFPHVIEREHGTIMEFPLATFSPFPSEKVRLPVAGGAYWRLFPLRYTLWGLDSRKQLQDEVTTCYFHPWELDPEQPYYEKLGFLSRLRHYKNNDKLESILDTILSRYTFESFEKNALAMPLIGERHV